MYRISRRALCALSIAAVLAGLTPSAPAEQAIRFAGSYELANIVEHGNQVDVTIDLTLRNPSVTDVNGGIVLLYSAQPGHSFLNSYSTVKTVPHMGMSDVSKTFTVPAAEFSLWQHGHDPVFKILVPTSSGTNEESIQALRVHPVQSGN